MRMYGADSEAAGEQVTLDVTSGDPSIKGVILRSTKELSDWCLRNRKPSSLFKGFDQFVWIFTDNPPCNSTTMSRFSLASLALALPASVNAMLRFSCSELVLDRLDP